MPSFKLTAKAKSDLKSIASFTERQWGRDKRNFYLKQLDDAFHMLANTSSIGKECDFIKAGYKKFPNGSHVIFYKAGSATKIEIIRILHKSMDITSKLSNS